MCDSDLEGKDALWTEEYEAQVIKALEADGEWGKGTSRRYYYINQKYKVVVVNNTKRVTRAEDGRMMARRTELFSILKNAHDNQGHKGDKKTYKLVSDKYANIPMVTVSAYIRQCKKCNRKNFQPSAVVATVKATPTPIQDRGLAYILDFQGHPEDDYGFALTYRDHLTKYLALRPLRTRSAKEVAGNILDIFLHFGIPQALQVEDDRKFTSEVIKHLAFLWPQIVLVNAKPLPGQKDAFDIRNSIMCWMRENKTPSWIKGLRFVQWNYNTARHENIKMTPFEATFGQKVRLGLRSNSKKKFGSSDNGIWEENVGAEEISRILVPANTENKRENYRNAKKEQEQILRKVFSHKKTEENKQATLSPEPTLPPSMKLHPLETKMAAVKPIPRRPVKIPRTPSPTPSIASSIATPEPPKKFFSDQKLCKTQEINQIKIRTVRTSIPTPVKTGSLSSPRAATLAKVKAEEAQRKSSTVKLQTRDCSNHKSTKQAESKKLRRRIKTPSPSPPTSPSPPITPSLSPPTSPTTSSATSPSYSPIPSRSPSPVKHDGIDNKSGKALDKKFRTKSQRTPSPGSPKPKRRSTCDGKTEKSAKCQKLESNLTKSNDVFKTEKIDKKIHCRLQRTPSPTSPKLKRRNTTDSKTEKTVRNERERKSRTPSPKPKRRTTTDSKDNKTTKTDPSRSRSLSPTSSRPKKRTITDKKTEETDKRAKSRSPSPKTVQSKKLSRTDSKGEKSDKDPKTEKSDKQQHIKSTPIKERRYSADDNENKNSKVKQRSTSKSSRTPSPKSKRHSTEDKKTERIDKRTEKSESNSKKRDKSHEKMEKMERRNQKRQSTSTRSSSLEPTELGEKSDKTAKSNKVNQSTSTRTPSPTKTPHSGKRHQQRHSSSAQTQLPDPQSGSPLRSEMSGSNQDNSDNKITSQSISTQTSPIRTTSIIRQSVIVDRNPNEANDNTPNINIRTPPTPQNDIDPRTTHLTNNNFSSHTDDGFVNAKYIMEELTSQNNVNHSPPHYINNDLTPPNSVNRSPSQFVNPELTSPNSINPSPAQFMNTELTPPNSVNRSPALFTSNAITPPNSVNRSPAHFANLSTMSPQNAALCSAAQFMNNEMTSQNRIEPSLTQFIGNDSTPQENEIASMRRFDAHSQITRNTLTPQYLTNNSTSQENEIVSMSQFFNNDFNLQRKETVSTSHFINNDSSSQDSNYFTSDIYNENTVDDDEVHNTQVYNNSISSLMSRNTSTPQINTPMSFSRPLSRNFIQIRPVHNFGQTDLFGNNFTSAFNFTKNYTTRFMNSSTPQFPLRPKPRPWHPWS